MSEWILGPDVLARAHFSISHLAVAIAALRREATLTSPAFADRLVDRPVHRALLSDSFTPSWVADCFTLAVPPARSLEEEVAPIRRLSDPQVRHDVAATQGRPVGAPLRRARRLGDAAADLLTWAWEDAVAQDWPRLRRVLEGDIVSRTAALGSGGWAAALEGIRPSTAYLGGGVLRVSGNDLPPKTLQDVELSFHPVPSGRGQVMWDLDAGRYAITYPATGTGIAPDTSDDRALGRLLGPNRARVLRLLEAPASTTQLVARTGLPLGSVGGHLAVLLGAGIVTRRRSGREVLYWRTPLGDDLVGVTGDRNQ